MLAAEFGRRFGFLGGTSGGVFSFSCIGDVVISSPKLDKRCDRLALSCIILNLSSSSFHFTPPSSLAFNRFGRSKLDTGGPCWLLGGPVSELFCLKWLKLEEGTYVRGAMCRYPIALTLLSRFFSAANADDCGSNISRP